MSFTYYSPYGTPLTVTQPSDLPDAPVVVTSPDGSSSVLWSDRGGSTAAVWIAPYRPGVGLGAKQRIFESSLPQPAVDAAVDAEGALHVVWQVSGSGVNQIHYQKRLPGLAPSPADTVIVSRGEGVQNPTLRADPTSGLHVAFIASNGGVQQVRYKRRAPDRGWDYASTEVTLVSEGPMARPALAPAALNDVSVLYLGFLPATRQFERRRLIESVAVAAPTPAPFVPGPALRLGPNPLRAGSPLVLRLDGAAGRAPPVVDILDLTGRRVTSAALTPGGDAAVAEIPGGTTGAWPSGVYFAHLRGADRHSARLVVIR